LVKPASRRGVEGRTKRGWNTVEHEPTGERVIRDFSRWENLKESMLTENLRTEQSYYEDSGVKEKSQHRQRVIVNNLRSGGKGEDKGRV